MTPPHWQAQVLPTSRIGFFVTSLVGATGGTQMPIGIGMQAIGLGPGPAGGGGLPMPIGFAGEMHIAIGVMFSIGTASETVSAGFPSINTPVGIPPRVPGPVLNEHMICPPTTAGGGMAVRYTMPGRLTATRSVTIE